MNRPDHNLTPFALAYFGLFAYMGAAGPWLTTYQRDLGFDQATSGKLMAAFTLSAIIGGWLAARRADARRERRRLQRALSIVAALAALCWLIVDDPGMALVILIVQGACIGPQIPMLDGATIDALGSERRRYGRVRVWGSVAWGLGTLIIGAVREFDPTAMAIIPWSMAGWLIVFHVVTWRLADTQSPARCESPRLDLGAACRSVPFVALLLASLLHGFAFSNYEYFSARTFEDLGVSPLGVSGILLVGIAFESLVFWVAPRLLARWSALTLASVALLATAGRWWITPHISSVSGFAMLQPTHAFTFALWYTAAMHLVARLVDDEVRTTGQTLQFMSFAIGMAIGVAVGGAIREEHGIATAFQQAAIVDVLAVVVLLAAARRFTVITPIGSR